MKHCHSCSNPDTRVGNNRIGGGIINSQVSVSTTCIGVIPINGYVIGTF